MADAKYSFDACLNIQFLMIMGQHLLTLMIFFPLLGAAVISAIPNSKAVYSKWVALMSTLIQLILAFIVSLGFRPSAGEGLMSEGFQYVEKAVWFELPLATFGAFKVDYYIGVDGISLPLIVLSSLLLVIGVISSWKLAHQARGYFILYLLLATSIVGCFLALDFFLFYLFFELMLLPMFFLIGIWGGKNRSYAAIKFFLYTLLGSLLILAVMIGLYLSVIDPADGSFSFNITYMMDPANYRENAWLGMESAKWLFGLPVREVAFLGLMIGFGIKLPVVPLHTWLPDAHVEAPTAISVILAGLLLKVGGYSFFRIAYSIFPDAALAWTFPIACVGVLSIVYGGMNALAQNDFKRLVAYSSVSHMGFVLLGISSITYEGASGALFHMVSHGLISGSLFLLVGVLYDRTAERGINNFSGLASRLPGYTFLITVAFFASLGLPGLSGFVGELLSLMGAFKSASLGNLPLWLPVLAVFGILISAVYYLWTLQRMFFGKYWVRDQSWESKMQDLSLREYLLLVPLALLIVTFGVWPRLLLDISSGTIREFITHIEQFVK